MTPDRTPPADEGAERALLGSILLDFGNRTMDLCDMYRIEAEAFYVPAHRRIFAAILAQHTAGQGIDAATVQQRLRAEGNLDTVGGGAFIDRLVDSTPTAAHAEHYAAIVNEKARLRAIIAQCRQTEAAAFDEAPPPDDLLIAHGAALDHIEAMRRVQEVAWGTTVDASIRAMEEARDSGKGVAGISTGFRNLDRVMMGLRAPDLIILAARTSHGKTSLAMNMAERVALAGHPVGVFSLEMSRAQLATRMLCSHAHVNAWHMERGYVDHAGLARLASAAATLRKAPLHCDDSAGLDVRQVRTRAKRMLAKHGIALLVVDYLQLLHDRESAREGRQYEVAAISRQLKEIAKELNVPVLAIAQLSRAVEIRDKKGVPQLTDLRDSGAIEQDADIVMLMHRPCRYEANELSHDKTLAIVDVAKSRNGPCGECRLNFAEEYTRFDDRVRGADGEAERGDDAEGN